MPTFAAIGKSYRPLWEGMKIHDAKVAAADQAARRILAGKARYQDVERRTKVPWFFVGLTHLREGNLNFGTYLGNGQSITRVTTIEPRGRGPWPTFEAGAVDALTKMQFINQPPGFWTLERIAYCLEGFNGYGYRGKGVNSPYLWASTNRYTKGKFPRDHVFDPNMVDTQLGSMAVLARLCAMDAEVNDRVNGKKDDGAVRSPAKDTILVGAAAGVGTAAASAKRGWSWWDYGEAALWIIVALLAVYCALKLWRHVTTKPAAKLIDDHPALLPAAPANENEKPAPRRRRRRAA